MFGYYSAPSHFHSQPSYPSARSSFYAPPSSSCRHQQRYPPSFSTFFDEEEDERDSSAAEYNRYLAVARREQERREVEESQARKRAQEKLAYLQAMARAQAEAEAEARAEAQAQARARAEYAARYTRYMQQQAEKQKQARQEEEQRQRRVQAAYRERIARAFLGYPNDHHYHATPVHTHPSPAPQITRPSEVSPATFTPAVQPLPVPAQPKMSYMEAAKLVQTLAKQQLSIRRRIKSLHAIQAHFEQLKQEFSMPDSLVFDITKSTPSTPVLAYNPANRPLQMFEEALTRLLTDLDSIPSEGSQRVRDERKTIATAIEKELSRLDAAKLGEWKKQQEAAKVAMQKETAETEIQQEGKQEGEQEETQVEEGLTIPTSEGEQMNLNVSPKHSDGEAEMELDVTKRPLEDTPASPQSTDISSTPEEQKREQPEVDQAHPPMASESDTISTERPASDSIILPSESFSSCSPTDNPSPASLSQAMEPSHTTSPGTAKASPSTSLPVPIFGLGMLDIVSDSEDLGTRVDEEDVHEDSDSDTSFEML